MIPHSQPSISSFLIDEIKNLLNKKDLQSVQMMENALGLFKEKFKQPNFYFTQSGSQALYWILKSLDLRSEDEVIMPTYVCSSLYKAVVAAGAKPILCDIGSYWHMSPATVEKKITSNTKVIIIVNLFGMYLDCAKFRYPGILLINDLCQSFDSCREQKKDNGDFGLFSFHPTKYITAGGGGGFSIYNPAIKFNNLLSKEQLHFSCSNLDLLIFTEQINLYDNFVSERQKIAECYFSACNKKYTQYITKVNNVFYRFPLVQKLYDFSYLQDYFAEKKIAVRRGVDELIHRIIGLSDEEFPNAVNAYATTLSLPIYPALSHEDVLWISKVIREVFND